MSAGQKVPGDMRVAILGAGPAGLAAGHHLSSRGVPLQVLELNDYVGGLCLTTDVNGFKFDLGGHRWFTKNKELHEWFLKLMEGELVTVERTSRIYFDRSYYNYPISLKNVLSNAGLLTCIHAGISYMKAAAIGTLTNKKPHNLRQAFVSQFGEKLFDMFFRRYTEKVWGCPCEEISADWVSQRSKGLSIFAAVKDAIVKNRNIVSLVDEFVYPRDGYQRICERLAAQHYSRADQAEHRLARPLGGHAVRGGTVRRDDRPRSPGWDPLQTPHPARGVLPRLHGDLWRLVHRRVLGVPLRARSDGTRGTVLLPSDAEPRGRSHGQRSRSTR